MKWITHEASVILLASALNAETFLFSTMLIGAVFPDIIDKKISFGNQKLFWKVHRGTSHCFILYLASLLLCLIIPSDLHEIRKFILGLSLGSLMHIIFDALNPTGVPIFPWRNKPRIALKFIKTASFQEYILLAFLLLLIALFNYPKLNLLI